MTMSALPVSPYTVGPAVRPENFWGRASQIDEFFRIMCGSTLQPLRVLGLRRSGKTSYLQYLSQRRVYEPRLDMGSRATVIAYVDLQELQQEKEASSTRFFSIVAEAIQEAMQHKEMDSDKATAKPATIAATDRDGQILKRKIAQARRNLYLIQERIAEYVMSVDVPLQLKKEEKKLLERIDQLTQEWAAQRNHASASIPTDFSTFKKWLRSILTADSKLQIIVLLDEFERLTESSAFDQAFFGNLRALASGPSLFWRFTWVVASHTDLHLLNQKIDESIKTSPLFNIFYPRPIILGGMEPAEVEQLICAPAEEFHIRFSREEIEAIKQLSGLLPYFVQATADQWLTTRSPAIALNDCRQIVLTRLIDASGQLSAQLNSYWNQLTTEERAYISQTAQARSMDRTNSIAEQKLLRLGLLHENEGQIQVSGEVFRQWLNQNLERLAAESPSVEDTAPAIPAPFAQSGGVTIHASTVNIGGDVTGRDKLETKAGTDVISESGQ